MPFFLFPYSASRVVISSLPAFAFPLRFEYPLHIFNIFYDFIKTILRRKPTKLIIACYVSLVLAIHFT